MTAAIASLNALGIRSRREVRLALDRIVDAYFSIDTVIAGSLPQAQESGRFADAYVNGPISYWILRQYMNWNTLGPNDVFYDIGCGHGRVLCYVARRRVAKCVGIELSAEFAEKARRNAASARGRVSPIEIRVGDATDMSYSDGTVFFFGDPFGPDTMLAVLRQIGDTVLEKPRSIRCTFVLTTSERSKSVEEVIRRSGWLTSAGQRSLPYSPMRVEYWAWQPKST